LRYFAKPVAYGFRHVENIEAMARRGGKSIVEGALTAEGLLS
jgi:hypothetical protein